MRRLQLILILILNCVATLSAQRSELAEAAKAYNDSNFILAVELYQQVGKRYGYDSELLYNMGNAYSHLDNYGAAVLNYRKALKFSSTNSEARHNLAYVEQKVAIANETQVADKNLDPTPQPVPFFSKFRMTFESFGSDFYAWLACALFLVICVCSATYFFATNPRFKKIGFFVGLVSILFCVISLITAYSAKSSALSEDECVLISPVASLKESASPESKDVAVPLTGGTSFKILDTIRSKSNQIWYKIYLNDEFTGWLPADEVEIIKV